MRFSVIIPIFNKAPYIEKALESVFSQTFGDFEIIVVDDGSSDDSLTVATAILEKCEFPHLLIHQENAGVSTARNNGISASSGDYVCFLDADDWWEPSFLERMDWLIKEYPDSGIYGSNYYYVKNGRHKICVDTAETGYINYCKVYSEKLQMPLWTGATCIPRVIFDEAGGFRPHLRLGEDFDLWIRIALAHKVAFLNEPLAYYFQDANRKWRGIGHLVDPKSHFLWNLDYLSEEEITNADYKKLVDRLRTYSLFPYYLSKQYRETAKRELAKVDWSMQSGKVRRLYNTSILVLKCRHFLLKCGSMIKQFIIRNI